MIATVKDTGETVYLSRVNTEEGRGHKVWFGNNQRYFTYELEFHNLIDISCKNCEIDWEQRRYEIAKGFLSGSLECLYMNNIDKERVVANALDIADELIKELKKG